MRPQTECALRGAAARGVKRHIWVQQERHVVASNIEIPLIDICDMRQCIEILDLRTVRGVHNRTVLAIGNAHNLVQRLALGKLHHLVIKFLARDEIDGRTIFQRSLRQHAYVRANESDFYARVGILDGLRQPDVSRETGCAGEQHQELIIFRDVNSLFC